MLEQIATMIDTLIAETAEGRRAPIAAEQCPLPIAPEPPPSSRQPSMSAAAVRARRWRAEKACGEPVSERSERSRTPGERVRERPANALSLHDSDPGTGPALLDPPDPLSTNIGREDPPNAFANAPRTPGAEAVVHDPERPPWWVFEDARALRPDLGEYDLREMWRSFVKRRRWHKSEEDARDHFGFWLPKEDRQRREANASALRKPTAPADDSPVSVEMPSPCDEDDRVRPRTALVDPDEVRATLERLFADEEPPEPRSMSA
jgi:hypothetical protein